MVNVLFNGVSMSDRILKGSMAISGLLFSAYVGAQTCNPAVAPSTPTNSFTIYNDGTVTHKSTGLMWQRCIAGQTWTGDICLGGVKTYSWPQAAALPGQNNFAGYNDWRLPNVKELTSIVEYACSLPALNQVIFRENITYNGFWASTPMPGNIHYPFRMSTQNGELWTDDGTPQPDINTVKTMVRLVRNAR